MSTDANLARALPAMGRKLRLGGVGGGAVAFIGQVHVRGCRIVGRLSPGRGHQAATGGWTRIAAIPTGARWRGVGGAAGRYRRGGNHRSEPSRSPGCHGFHGCGHRRDLRQAAGQYAGRPDQLRERRLQVGGSLLGPLCPVKRGSRNNMSLLRDVESMSNSSQICDARLSAADIIGRD